MVEDLTRLSGKLSLDEGEIMEVKIQPCSVVDVENVTWWGNC
jgi:hypothetical protein